MSENAISKSTSCYMGSCGGLSTHQLSHTWAGILSYVEICDQLRRKYVNNQCILKYFQQCFVIYLLLIFLDFHIKDILHSLLNQWVLLANSSPLPSIMLSIWTVIHLCHIPWFYMDTQQLYLIIGCHGNQYSTQHLHLVIGCHGNHDSTWIHSNYTLS